MRVIHFGGAPTLGHLLVRDPPPVLIWVKYGLIWDVETGSRIDCT